MERPDGGNDDVASTNQRPHRLRPVHVGGADLESAQTLRHAVQLFGRARRQDGANAAAHECFGDEAAGVSGRAEDHDGRPVRHWISSSLSRDRR
jgi:hypothetical protein